jgi:hypothetical protein
MLFTTIRQSGDDHIEPLKHVGIAGAQHAFACGLTDIPPRPAGEGKREAICELGGGGCYRDGPPPPFHVAVAVNVQVQVAFHEK